MGEEEEKFCGVFSLAKVWAEEPGDAGGWACGGRRAPALGTPQASLTWVSPRLAPAFHKQNRNTRKNNSYPLGGKVDQFITRYIIQPK